MIVVDLGCSEWPGRHPSDRSAQKLVDRFAPDAYYGVDPTPTPLEMRPCPPVVTVLPYAAWTFDGRVSLDVQPGYELRTKVVPGYGSESVECIDLARFLLGLPEPAVVKMDVEGAEYELIRHLTARWAWQSVALLLVEWHGDQPRPAIPVPWEEWS